MKLCIHDNATEFLEATYGLLMEDEVLNNLPIGVAQAVRDGKAYGKGSPFFASVETGGRTVASFLRTPPYALHVYSEESYQDEAFEILIQHFDRQRICPPGVIGEKAAAAAFAQLWCERFRDVWTLGKGMRVFRLDAVETFPDVGGSLELARPDQMDFLVGWVCSFQEAVGDVREPEYVEKTVAEMIEKQSLYLWLDLENRPVSCACNLRKIVTGEVINLVYTPAEQRGKGYASAAVAQLSQNLLDKGAAFCCLFTDNENPISNKIYQRIGYKPVAEYSMLNFGE